MKGRKDNTRRVDSAVREHRGLARTRAAGAALAVLAAAAGLVCGCATTDDSDMPWNTPQTWEGTPSLPGGLGQP